MRVIKDPVDGNDIPQTVDALESVDEMYREFYKRDERGWHIPDGTFDALTVEIEAYKTNNADELAALAAQKAKIAELDAKEKHLNDKIADLKLIAAMRPVLEQHVRPDLIPGAIALIKKDLKLSFDEHDRLLVGTAGGITTFSAWAANWIETDEGQAFADAQKRKEREQSTQFSDMLSRALH